MAYYPLAVTHVGMTVTDICAATTWYTEALGCRRTIGPLHITDDGSPIGNVFKGIFGKRMEDLYVSHLATANGVGIEVFQFLTPPTEDNKKNNFEYWKTGVFHFCVASRCCGLILGHEDCTRIKGEGSASEQSLLIVTGMLTGTSPNHAASRRPF